MEDVDDHLLDIFNGNDGCLAEYNDGLDDYEQDKILVGKEMGRTTKIMLNNMESVENIMKYSGWFDKSPDGPPEYDNLDHINPSMQLHPKE